MKIEKLKNIFCKLPRLLGENAFLSFLALLLIALLLSSAVFYRYVFAIKSVEIAGVASTTSFRKDTFQGVLNTWEARAERFEAAASEDYRNIFQPTPTILQEPQKEALPPAAP